ncbi:nodulation protein NfeD [Chungangia koreensis]|uniref:Nodulation protein NfeD n=1 Tax=Chungangia koreensis TaxID=752657 RepID=A0ABV8X579_9LACT
MALKINALKLLPVFLLSLLFFLPITVMADEVYHIPIEEEVEKGLSAYLDRALDEAEENGADAVIFEIHTPGGFVNAAGDIGKRIQNSPLKTIAYINREAHSAGAYIALHADEIYFAPGATMGSAAVIDQAGNAADEKATSAWLAQMASAAESTNREPIYAKAMADKNIDLPDFGAPKGSLLTLSASDALKVGYSNGTAASINEVMEMAGLANADLIPVEMTIAEKIARFITNPVVVPILLSIASLGLIVELYSPGFGIPGLMGISALILFFYGHMVAGLAGHESIILFVVGVILVVAEIFLPGGIAGLLGFGAIIGSIILAGGNMLYMTISVVIALLVAIIGMVILVKIFGKKMHLLNRLILKDATNTESGYVSNVNRLDLLGKTGISLTPLRPSGTIIVEEERIDAVTEGSYLDSNTAVKVVKVEGSRIVVRKMLD